MILTKDAVDAMAPEHERTSCTDEGRENAFGGWSGEYDRHTGNKEIRFPRCVRCYLLDHLGEDTKNLEFKIACHLEWVEPHGG